MMPKKLTTESFIMKATDVHNNFYDYSDVQYDNSQINVVIVCPIHGSFSQQPYRHLQGQGCPICGRHKCDDNRKISQQDFIHRSQKIHGDKYNYDKTRYERNDKKVVIGCNKHGDFLQIAYDHIRGRGCPKCAKTKFSTMAINWLDNISRQRNISIQHAGNNKEFMIPNSNYRADGYCKETNTIFEFYGDKWHGNPLVFNDDDQCNPFSDVSAGELYQKTIEREEFIRNQGFKLETIWESEYLQEN